MTDIRHVFAAEVRAARKRLGLTQMHPAEAAGLSLDVIGSLEQKVNIPTIETAAKVIAALGIDAGAVFMSSAKERRVTPARRDVEAEIFRHLEGMDDRGAVLLLELAIAVAKAHPPSPRRAEG